MKICLINNMYPPLNTGSALYTRDLAFKLYELGHKVVVITNFTKEKSTHYNENGIKIYRLSIKKLPKFNIWLKFPDFNFTITPRNISKIKKILIDEKIQIIHQCNNIFDLVFASALMKCKLKIPLVCSLTTQIQHPNKIYNFLLMIFDKLVIYQGFARHVNKYIALDKETQRYIIERYNIQKIKIIPHSITEGKFRNLLLNFKIDYKITHFKMISLGHISGVKNRYEIIKAWKLVIKSYPLARLKIVGGLFDDKTNKLIKSLNLHENISFTDQVPHESIINEITDSDFGCMFLSSNLPYSKGLGTANMELMAAGLPVIADIDDDFLGEKYPIKAGIHYVKIETRNPEWLAAKFIELFEKPRLREFIGKNARDFIENILTWDKITQEITKLYDEVIKETRNYI